MDLLDLLDELQTVVESAGKLPLTGKVVLDREEVLTLLAEIRRVLPPELEQAARLAKQRDSILNQARQEAEAVVREARAFAAQLTDETAIAREAQARADEVIDQSKRVAREIRQGARAYADEVLAHLEAGIERELAVIRSHRQELNGR